MSMLSRMLDGTGCVNERVDIVSVELGNAALTARGWAGGTPVIAVSACSSGCADIASEGWPNTAAGPREG